MYYDIKKHVLSAAKKVTRCSVGYVQEAKKLLASTPCISKTYTHT